MSFNGQISGSLAPQGAMTGSVSGSIGAVTPAIRDGAVTTAKLADEAVTTAKIADAAVTIAKLAADVTALINSKGSASDVATLQSDVAALQTITEGLGTASTYGVANNLTTAAAGANVLDAYQGKVLGDRMTTAEGDIDTLNDGLANLIKRVTITGTTSSAGVYPTEYSFNRVISAHPVTGTTAYLAIRESASNKAVVFAYTSSGGSLTSVNNTAITFELIYI